MIIFIFTDMKLTNSLFQFILGNGVSWNKAKCMYICLVKYIYINMMKYTDNGYVRFSLMNNNKL